MKQILLSFIFAILLSITAFSQNYDTGIGLRGGNSYRSGFAYGITIKKFVSQTNAIEAILALRYKGIGITGLYEIHTTAFGVPELQLYYGFGAHLGFWDDNRRDYEPLFNDDTETVAGIDGIIGLEYTIKEIPFSISVDYHPYVNIIRYYGLQGTAAISIRFLF
ncbi:MAG: hypothetical protein KDD63_00730 [Bacteroidetes bacterium]|nr:hypothetical protein [Bacteroidota bacterium]MCB0845532.1 hypothetical protein [Bacteroidota bacterium]MCB0850738.1 hypothetical protein [Bacteroidota bacterium]